uniref:G-protein coupled receptors family 1 profile domain-containing protein n=1 Tax=Cairina moschata TaxID=8855 RepID=A0A8C3C3N0_CAIMO
MEKQQQGWRVFVQPPVSSGLRGRRQAALSPAAASWSQLSTSGCRRLRLCPWAVAQLRLPVPGERRAGGAPGCLAQHARHRAYAYAMVGFFAAAFLVVLGSYVSVARSLSAPAVTAASPGSHRQQARAMVLGMLLVFVVCVAPYHLTLAPWVGSRPPVPPCGPPAVLDVLHALSVALLSLNSCLDPLVYCFCIRRFRADLGRTLRKAARCLPLPPQAPDAPVPSGAGVPPAPGCSALLRHSQTPWPGWMEQLSTCHGALPRQSRAGAPRRAHPVVLLVE